MYRKELIKRGWSMNAFYHAARSYDNLGIEKVDREYYPNSDKLVLWVSTREKLDGEPNAFLKEHHLVVESPISAELNPPQRSHLMEEELFANDMGLTIIGFSEIELKPHCSYTVEYTRLINPNLLKIVLKTKKLLFHPNHARYRYRKDKHRMN